MVFSGLICCLILSLTAHGWKCGGVYDQISPLAPSVCASRRSDQGPLRVSWISDNVDIEEFDHSLDDSTSRVSNYFKSALKVNQLQGNLILTGLQSCGGYSKIPEQVLTTGIPNTDVLIFLSTFNDSNLNYLAKAGACVVDPGNLNQTLAGYVSINSDEYHRSNSDEKSLFTVLLHEVIHVLGFSRNLMKYWKDKNGSSYGTPVTKNITVRSIPKNVLVTPAAINAARYHTGCNYYPGIELEEYEESRSSWNHIDGFFSINDLMSYTVNLEVYPSIYVAAILEDTGHYLVNNEYIFDPPWQKYVGCKFQNKSCIIDDYSQYPDFVCDEDTPDACDVSGVFRSKCEIHESIGNVKDYYKHFSDRKIGGDSFTDFCPTYQTEESEICWGSSDPTDITSDFGEQTGPDSVCMMSTIYRLPILMTKRHSACFRVVSCSNTGTKVQIGDTTVTCPLEGGNIPVPGYTGTLECPSADIMCKGRPCYRACLGQGKCVMGRCQCNPGFSGADCSIVCHPSCRRCISSLASDCVTCYKENYIISSQGCICPINFILNDQGDCLRAVKCVNCEKCVNNNCVECKKNFTIVGTDCVCDKGYAKSSSGNCDTCMSGYYAKDEKCLKCAYPCFTCKDETTCTSCLNDFVLIASQCLNSVACIKSWYGYCLQCADFYYLADGNCLECIPGCQSCSRKNTCDKCAGDLVLIDNSCVCSEKCADCNQIDFKCRSCKTGFYLMNGVCLSCLVSCKNCICPSKCVECRGSFELSYDGGCFCPNSCRECEFANYTCLSCNPGYFLENGFCIKCPPSCETCSSLTKCLSCRGSYVLQSNFTCQCSDSCIMCEQFDFTCLLCKEKYYLELGKCFPCIPPCDRCSSAENCTSCLSNLLLTDSNRCTCPLTCAQCDDSLGCIKCFQGFYLAQQECRRCTGPCKVCTGPDQCLECLGHYLPDSDGKCKCPNCCSCDSQSYFCRAPFEGYFLTKSGCSKCADQCKTCSGSSITCTSCKGSLQLIGNECAWPLKCTKINLTTFECLECESTHTLDPVTKQCIRCGVACSCCFDNGGKCITCKGIYETNPNNSSECICPLSKCKECNSTTFLCKDCYPGSILINGTCESCNPLCQECNISTRFCTKCKGVFELDGSMCLCPKTCKNCDFSTYSCTSCYDGYYLTNSTCKLCSPNCKTCSGSNTTCTSCFNKYSLLNNTCNCPSNCESCDPKMFSCTRCKTGYVSIDGVCQPCNSPCKTCIDNQNTCTSCYGSAVLDGSTCVCSRFCKSCNSSTLQCLVCKEGFYLNSSTCTPCNSMCKECNGVTANNCTSCFNTYKLDKGTCVKPDNCDIGDPANFICINCTAGYFIRNGACYKCSPRCKTCQTKEDICLSCQGNLRQIDSRCEFPEGCLNMVNFTNCTLCDKGYALINGSCFRCEYNCLTCDKSIKNCTSCSSAFNYLVSASQLGICEPHSSCLSLIPSTLLCGVCSDEHYLYKGFCVACQPPCKRCLSDTYCLSCIPNYELNYETGICSYSPQCTIRNVTTSKCQVCREGTYLSDGEGTGLSDRECHYCTSSCKTCVGSPTNCTSCYSDFQVNSRGQCCPRSCNYCYLGSETCRECNDGFFLNNGRCFQCEKPCKTCNSNSTTCTSCLGSYVLDNKQCKCPSQCNECDCSFLCTSCKTRYYLSNSSCLPCSSNCLNCTQNNNCLVCENNLIINQGYCVCPQGSYLNASTCVACNQTCSTCVGQNNCTSCVDKFYLNKTTCLACNQTCSKCVGQNNCTMCIGGYYLNSTSCLACDKNCLNCTSAKNCTKCNDTFISVNGTCACPLGTYLDNNICRPCSQNCLNCTGNSSCVACNKGLYLEQGQCKLCATNCTSCISATNCSECSIGYFFNKSSCPPCSSNCSSCSSSQTNCTSCKVGFYLASNNSCISCPKNCSNCVGSNNCTICNDGYYLNNSLCQNCSQYCAKCRGPSCDTCMTGYRLTNTSQCTDRPIGCAIYDYSKYKCLVCENEYELCADGSCKPKQGT